MIEISLDLNNVEFRVTALEATYQVLKVAANPGLEEFATEFGREHEMVACVEYGVALSVVDHQSLR